MRDAGEDRHAPQAPPSRLAETLDGSNPATAPPPPARPPHKEPESIGPHRIIERLGEGGMGVVYRAEQREPVRRMVALKVIKLGMDTKEVVARFEAERQALAMMNHPNVAKVFDAGVTEQGRPYFAMEFVAGVPLTQYCDDAKLTTRQRLDLFIAVCHAVQHAHQKGIIHRDLKPSNILVTMFDGRPVPKVIDFGIAKATNAALTQHTLYTRTGTTIGTPEYMSPEQAVTSGLDVDTRTDIYSLGVILYELLTGTLPFDAETLRKAGPDGFARIIREAEPSRPSTRLVQLGKTHANTPPGTKDRLGKATVADATNPAADDGDDGATRVAKRHRTDTRSLMKEVRGDLDWIVLKAIEKDRTRRYETANALAMDVQRHLGDEPVLARPPSTVYRLRKLGRRYRVAVLTMMLVTAALLVAVVGTGVGLVRARAAQHRAEAAEHVANVEREAAKTARAAAERDARRAVAANKFMRDMFASARPEANAGGEQVKVADVLDNAAAALNHMTDQPELKLDSRLTLADTYASLSLFHKAVENYNRALALSRQLWGPESEQALQATADVVAQMSKAGTGAAAEPIARQGVQVARRTWGERHPVTLDLLNSLGLAMSDAGKHVEAEEVFRGLVKGVRADGAPRGGKGSARFFDNLATAVAAQGRTEEAEQLLREGIAQAQREAARDPQRTASLLTNLAVTLGQQNRLAEAEAALRDALDHARNTLGADHPDTLGAMVQLARLHEQRGNYADSLPLRREQLVLAREGKRESTAVDAQVTIAQLLAETGHAAEAREAFDAALVEHRKASTPRPDVARQCWALANVYLGMGKAESWAGPALQAFATHAAYDVLSAHGYSSPSLDEVKWDAMRFRLDAWPPTTPPPIPTAGKPTPPLEPGLLAGGLAELRTAADPPSGIYLFSMAIPRQHGRTLYKAMWIYVAPWQLTLHAPGTPADAWDETKWQKFFAAEPLERRTEPALALDRVGLLDRGFGPFGRADGFALSATTQLKVPPGAYKLRLLTVGRGRVFAGGYTIGYNVLDPLTPHTDLTTLADSEANAELRVLAPEISNRLVLTVEPQGPDAERMMRAVRGKAHSEAGAERLAEQIANGDTQPETIAQLADELARSGRFEEAAARYAEAIALKPDEHWWQYDNIAILAWLGHEEAYRQACAAMLKNFGDTKRIEVGDRVAKACLILPGAVTDTAAISELIDRAVAGGADQAFLPFFLMNKGLAEYRAGRYAAALPHLEQAQPTFAPFHDVYKANCAVLRAMTLFKLGRPVEARQAMADADTGMRGVYFEPGFDDFSGPLLDTLLYDLLRREAKAMLDEDGHN